MWPIVLWWTLLEGLGLVALPLCFALFGSGSAHGYAFAKIEPATVIDRLVEAVHEVMPSYDFIVIDTPPNLGLLFTAALKAATHVIVPVAAQYLPLEGVGDLLVRFARSGKIGNGTYLLGLDDLSANF